MSYEIDVGFEYDGYDTCTGVLEIIVDGELVSKFFDGGQPEDQTFGRDWSWVSGELKKAYELGRKHAVRDIVDEKTRSNKVDISIESYKKCKVYKEFIESITEASLMELGDAYDMKEAAIKALKGG